MQTYQINKVTDSRGKITITGLPPSKELTILILPSGQHDWHNRMKQWMNDLREDHPFTKMSKDEILNQLKKSREQVWKAEYDH